MREARAQTACAAGLCIALAGCASAPAINAPLPGGATVNTGYYPHADADRRSSPSLLLVLAFSGGGTRAAALAYGVLEKLTATSITWDGRVRRLLDEVDLISSVSGGSFTAAYYGLFGERLFRDFEARFLKRDIEGELLGRLLSPWHWPRLWFSSHSRTDLAAEFYDEVLFEGKTVGDIKRRGAPF
ncbi:MAG: patatin-like phospholipase family protein, partial [Pseudomonadota bacterium]